MKLSQQIANWNRRARQRNLAHDLSAAQWCETLAFFDYKCAYCGQPAQTMDHYYPLALTGDDPLLTGTSAGNCLPSCLICNQRKGFTHPQHWDAWCPADRVDIIHQFVARHVERKRVLRNYLEHFNRRWSRTSTILRQFQEYAEQQSEQEWNGLGFLALELAWLTIPWNVPKLLDHLHDQEAQATTPGQKALYHNALRFLEEIIEDVDPDHLTLE